MLKEYVSVDLEMTGLNPKEDRIIEIGAVKVCEGKILKSFSVLVNPHRELPDHIKEITGLTNEELETGVEDWEGVLAFKEFAGELPLVGHHIISDFSFLKTCAANRKEGFANPVVDTLNIARKLLPSQQPKNLMALCKYAGISLEGNHRALEDAIATHKLFQWLQTFWEEEQSLFLPRPLDYKVKRQSPITKAQIRQLTQLVEYHNLTLDIEVGSLTRNEASRRIDKILFTYGRIPKA